MNRSARFYGFTVATIVFGTALTLWARAVLPAAGFWVVTAVVIAAAVAMWLLRNHAKPEAPQPPAPTEPRPQLGGGIFISHSPGSGIDGAKIATSGPALVVHESPEFAGRDLDIKDPPPAP